MSGHYRPPPPKSASRASASTVCQKCLKRGHYSYECKSVAQNRPYIPRPSRTQQLLNPKLVPKLNSDVPNDLLRKKGIADEELAKAAAERGRKRSVSEEQEDPAMPRKRSRSAYSSSSVSTISTTASRSPSPHRSRPLEDTYMTSQHAPDAPTLHQPGKRRRASSSQFSSDSDRDLDRNTRRRRQSNSPGERGRRWGRAQQGDRKRSPARHHLAHMRNYSSSPHHRRRKSTSMTPQLHEDTSTRRAKSRSASSSPYRRGGKDRRGIHQSRSPQRNTKKGAWGDGNRAREPPRERSLSPYSKRLALTRAVGRG